MQFFLTCLPLLCKKKVYQHYKNGQALNQTEYVANITNLNHAVMHIKLIKSDSGGEDKKRERERENKPLFI
jgi:hypothetical protein